MAHSWVGLSTPGHRRPRTFLTFLLAEHFRTHCLHLLVKQLYSVPRDEAIPTCSYWIDGSLRRTMLYTIPKHQIHYCKSRGKICSEQTLTSSWPHLASSDPMALWVYIAMPCLKSLWHLWFPGYHYRSGLWTTGQTPSHAQTTARGPWSTRKTMNSYLLINTKGHDE